METKEAVFFVKKKYDTEFNQENNADRNKADEVVALLELGGAYKNIVDALDKQILDKKDIYANWLRSDIKRLKKEHLKGVKKENGSGKIK